MRKRKLKQVDLKVPFDEKSFVVSGSEIDRSIMGAISFHGGYYEPYVMEVLKRHLTTDSVCIDIGQILALSHL
jgi:hypothetical protein